MRTHGHRSSLAHQSRANRPLCRRPPQRRTRSGTRHRRIHPPCRPFCAGACRPKRGAIFLQSSTRSPAQVWNILQHKRAFADPYDEGIPYYLYNLAAPDCYDRIYICHEHAANSALSACAAELGAQLIRLEFL
ncbi:TRSP domain-containing protein [Rappaport israeli]|uniref:TRSP domain-containing protein n=1 Tax=Rappaport israeli TaxID=1839807 RepID=UPI0038CD26B2